MRTRITFLAGIMLLSSISMMGRVVEISSATQLINAITTEALDNDTVLVPEGTFDIASGTRTISKTITIKANPSATSTPKVRARLAIGGNISLTLEDLEFYYDQDSTTTATSNHFIDTRVAAYSIPALTIKNCHIHGYGRSIIRADASATIPTITNLTIDNCLIEDIGRQANNYQAFAVHYANISNATIKNSTFYRCKGGLWQGNVNQNFPINFTMEDCCIIRVSTTGSKRIIDSKTNPGSVYTMKDCIITNSYDGVTEYLQLSLGSDGSTHLGHVDNVILANNFNPIKFDATILTTNNEVAVTSLSYNFDSLTINTSPSSISNIGDSDWIINGITTAEKPLPSSSLYGYIENNQLNIHNLPTNSKIIIYSLSGSHIATKYSTGTFFQTPVNCSCIVNIISDRQNTRLKFIK